MLLSYVLLDDCEQRFTIVAIKIACPTEEAVNTFLFRFLQFIQNMFFRFKLGFAVVITIPHENPIKHLVEELLFC